MTPLMQRLAGKHALVTGAGSGIGRAIALRLAGEGAHVAILEMTPEAGETTATAIRAAGGTAVVLAADVSRTESMRVAFDQFERLDILVNNAGIAHVGTVLTTTPDDLDRIYAVNVKGVYHGLHFGVPKLLAAGGGAIVNLASIASKLALADRFAYGMSKGAVLTMTLSVARDFIDRKSGAIASVRHASTRLLSTVSSRRTTRARKRRRSRNSQPRSPLGGWRSPRK